MASDSPVRERPSTPAAFDFDGVGSLHLLVLPSWQGRLQEPVPGMPPTVSFRESSDGPDRLLISVQAFDPAEPPNSQAFRVQLTQAFETLRGSIVERNIRFHPIATRDGDGCFFTVTDASPRPGEFLFMTSGHVRAGRIVLSFTILTNAGEAMLFAQALATIRSAIHVADRAEPMERTDDGGSLEESLKTFLQIDLNSEASLFVQDHPAVMSNSALQLLSAMASVSCGTPAHAFAIGGGFAILQARRLGVAGALAPAALASLPEQVLQLMDASLSNDGPMPREAYDAQLEAMRRHASAETSPRLPAVVYLMLAQQAVEPADDHSDHVTTHLESALAACGSEADVFVRAAISTVLSRRYLDRSDGEIAIHVETAIAFAISAVALLDASGLVDNWLDSKNLLGLGYARRVRGFSADNQESAIACFTSALTFCQSRNSMWGRLQHNLGSTFLQRQVSSPLDNAKAALEHLELALTVRNRNETPDAWAATQTNLGNAQRRLATFDIEANERAIEHYTLALEVLTRDADPVDWAGIQHNLGVVYEDREIGKPADNTATAIGCFTAALSIRTLDLFPREHRSSQIALGGVQLAQRRWADACTAFTGAIAADGLLTARTTTRAGIEEESKEAGSLYGDAAYCMLQLGREAEAFGTLDNGKVRVLSRAFHPSLIETDESVSDAERQLDLQNATTELEAAFLRLDAGQSEATAAHGVDRDSLDELRSRVPALVARVRSLRREGVAADAPPPLADLLAAIPRDGAIVAPIVTDAGSAAFVIGGESVEVHAGQVVWIDSFTRGDLERLLVGAGGAGQLDGWLPSLFRRSNEPKHWRRVISDTGSTLWRDLFEPIHLRLVELGMGPESPVVLLLPAGLSILPMHAAWREVNGSTRYAADDYAISYCPSASVLAHTSEQLRRRERSGQSLAADILVFADPTGDLPFAGLEGRAIADLGGTRAELLQGAAASWLAVSQRFQKRSYLHFACHGFYDLQYPMRSFLSLSGLGATSGFEHSTGRLRLHELIDAWQTGAARLVTLSGCETGVTDVTTAANEYMGLSTGWLRTGALGVISSLWRVDDLATMLLMEQFYQLHLGTGGQATAATRSRPDVALRGAQLWLRDLSTQSICERLLLWESRHDLTDEQRASVAIRRRQLAARPSGERPFSEPDWWAGFTFSGV